MTLPPPQPQGHRLIELLTLEFAEAAYQRRSTSAGRARKSAFSAFATSLPRQAVKWARYVEDGRKTIVLSCELCFRSYNVPIAIHFAFALGMSTFLIATC